MKVHVRRDDMVEILTGDDRGKQGRVLKVYPEKGRLIVQGCNIVVRHTRRNRDYPNGARVRKEAPLAVSNVLPVCPGCNRGRRYLTEVREGAKVRLCRKCGKEIPTLS